MRSYTIDVVDANDIPVAFWSRLTEAQMVSILTTIVVCGHHYISVKVHLED